MGITDNPDDPRLTHEADDAPTEQAPVYLVLPEAERAKGFVRPVRRQYIHTTCGVATRMNLALAETWARRPSFYGATWCCGCSMHLPVDQFVWDGTDEILGS